MAGACRVLLVAAVLPLVAQTFETQDRAHAHTYASVSATAFANAARAVRAGNKMLLAASREQVESEAERLFGAYLAKYDRVHPSPVERARRLAMFKEHLHHVADLNRQPKTPGHTATYGITEFADWSDDEFEARLGLVRDAKAMPANLTSVGPPGGQCTSTDATPKHTCQQTWNDTSFNNASVDKAWDWRGVPNVITPVKNQASCGGCWAFSATETVEATWAINQMVDLGPLSVQQILDCDDEKSGSCCGGLPYHALSYVVNNLDHTIQGLVTEKSNPFTCGKSGCHSGSAATCGEWYNSYGCASCKNCKVDSLTTKNPTKMPLGSYAYVIGTCECPYIDKAKDANYELNMRAALRWIGPLAVTVDAYPWKGYTGGIIRRHCSSTAENHAVQAVGYGEEIVEGEAIPYWIVRNSWGPAWGEEGFLRVYRGENTCGIASLCTFGWL